MKILFTSALFLATIAAFGQEKTAEQFKHLDKNGDEKLTVEEAPERARLIRAADADKSGDATLAEIAAILKLGLRRTQPDPNTPPSTTVAEKFPEDALFTKTSCQRAAQYSDEANGHAVVVMHRGKILFEHYANRWSAEKPHRLASGTKSFSGAMLAAAVKDGLLTLDEPVSKTITEWKTDEKLAVITIQDLLSLTSGIHPGTVGKVPAYAESIVQKTPKKTPGEKFSYGPAPFQVFGEIMRRKLDGTDPLAYLKNEILDPIGMEIGFWNRGSDTHPQLPSGAHIKATEWIKFGEFLRTDNGNVLDKKTGGSLHQRLNREPTIRHSILASRRGLYGCRRRKTKALCSP